MKQSRIVFEGIFIAIIIGLFCIFAGTALSADVSLAWDANVEPDLDHYTLYQAEKIGNKTTAWIEVATIPAGTTTITVTVEDGKGFAWLVSASDSGGNESFVSNMVEHIHKKQPPGHLRKE